MLTGVKNSKDINTTMLHTVGVLNCTYGTIEKLFGKPTFSSTMGDMFDGAESRAWHLQLQNGTIVRICDERKFGDSDSKTAKISRWLVQARSDKTFKIINAFVDEYLKSSDNKSSYVVEL